MENEIVDNSEAMLEQVSEFKTVHNRAERRKRLKHFVKQFKKHRAKLKNLKPLDKIASEEDIAKRMDFIKKHMGHSLILKDYVRAFLPKNFKEELLVFKNNGDIYYDGKQL